MSSNSIGLSSTAAARASLLSEKLFEDTVIGFRPTNAPQMSVALADLTIDGLEPEPIGLTAEQAFRRLLAFARQPALVS